MLPLQLVLYSSEPLRLLLSSSPTPTPTLSAPVSLSLSVSRSWCFRLCGCRITVRSGSLSQTRPRRKHDWQRSSPSQLWSSHFFLRFLHVRHPDRTRPVVANRRRIGRSRRGESVVERVGGGVEVRMEVLLAMLFRFETPLRCWLLASENTILELVVAPTAQISATLMADGANTVLRWIEESRAADSCPGIHLVTLSFPSWSVPSSGGR
jgi:hypothetical protein